MEAFTPRSPARVQDCPRAGLQPVSSSRHTMKTHRGNSVQLTRALFALALGLFVSEAVQAASWVTNSPLNTARKDHTATLLPNGNVLVAGGEGDPNGTPANTEFYDPATGT